MEFIKFCEKFALAVVSVADNVVDYCTQPLIDILYEKNIPQWIINLLPENVETLLADNTVVTIMFGVGLPVFLGVLLVKFLSGLVRG